MLREPAELAAVVRRRVEDVARGTERARRSRSIDAARCGRPGTFSSSTSGRLRPRLEHLLGPHDGEAVHALVLRRRRLRRAEQTRRPLHGGDMKTTSGARAPYRSRSAAAVIASTSTHHDSEPVSAWKSAHATASKSSPPMQRKRPVEPNNATCASRKPRRARAEATNGKEGGERARSRRDLRARAACRAALLARASRPAAAEHDEAGCAVPARRRADAHE